MSPSSRSFEPPAARRGLLSRIASQAGRPDPQTSILAHLHALLNTRRGESLVCPAMGLVDFADVVHRFPASAVELLRDIEGMISNYEPRLRDIEIHPIECDDPLRMRFEIHARLTATPRHSIHIRTELAADGHFDLTGA